MDDGGECQWQWHHSLSPPMFLKIIECHYEQFILCEELITASLNLLITSYILYYKCSPHLLLRSMQSSIYRCITLKKISHNVYEKRATKTERKWVDFISVAAQAILIIENKLI